MSKKRRRRVSRGFSAKDIENWIDSNPDYRALLKETMVDYGMVVVNKRMLKLEKDIKVQASKLVKEYHSDRRLGAIGPTTVGVFLACLAAETKAFIDGYEQYYGEPEIELEEYKRWAAEKGRKWIYLFSSWELDDLFKDRKAFREIIAQIVERYLPENFWNKMEGEAMLKDPLMRRLILRDILGEE